MRVSIFSAFGFLLCLLGPAVFAARHVPLVIAGGRPLALESVVAETVCVLWNNPFTPDAPCTVLPLRDVRDVAKSLRNQHIDAALMTSDWAYSLYRGSNYFHGSRLRYLRVLASVGKNILYIFRRKTTGPLPKVVGALAGNGYMRFVLSTLRATNNPLLHLRKIVYYPSRGAAWKALCSGKIAYLMLFVPTVSRPEISLSFGRCPVSLVSLPRGRSLARSLPGYIYVRVRTKKHTVTSIGLSLLLVVNAVERSKAPSSLLRLLRKQKEKITELSGQRVTFSAPNNLIPLYRGH